MDESKKDILIDYYRRYRKLGKNDEQISAYLIQNKFATQNDINEILPKSKKKEIPYILISIIGVPIIITIILLILIFTIGGSKTVAPTQTYYSNADEIAAYEEENYESLSYEEEEEEESIEEDWIVEEESETIEEKKDIVEQEEEVQENNEVIGDNESIDISKLDKDNPVKIDLSNVELTLAKKYLENKTLEMEFEIKGYVVQFEDEVSVLHSTSGLDFLYEEGIDEVEIEDMLNEGEVIDDNYLVNGDNYYRLALYVEVYDRHIYSDALHIKFENLIDTNNTIEINETNQGNETLE